VNPYFKAHPDSALFDNEAFSTARAEFFENRDRFLDRLACAQYFDAERFEATLLWLESLKRFHEAHSEPMSPAYFERADSISNHLEIQSRYSTKQKQVCAAALGRWHEVLIAFRVRK
jgi:hypothetical protein